MANGGGRRSTSQALSLAALCSSDAKSVCPRAAHVRLMGRRLGGMRLGLWEAKKRMAPRGAFQAPGSGKLRPDVKAAFASMHGLASALRRHSPHL